VTVKRRKHRPKPHMPPAPRIDATTERAEQQLFEEAFAQSIWRRGVPLL
jgi:hypothetical protein